MPVLLLTGAGRGIGLEFARQYAAKGWEVIATVRDAAQADALKVLGARVEILDMRDFAAVEAFPERLGGAPLDLFIANAGMTAAPRIGTAAEAEAWTEVHAVNAVTPTLLAARLLPNVSAAQGKLIAIRAAWAASPTAPAAISATAPRRRRSTPRGGRWRSNGAGSR